MKRGEDKRWDRQLERERADAPKEQWMKREA